MNVKKTQVFLLAFLILLVDQVFKIYIKTNYYMGQETVLFESLPWFRLHFVENEGMAYGWKFGGSWGKIALTTFRLIAVAIGTFYLLSIIKKKFHTGYIVCVTFIYAGAIGNLVDSLFYGMVFELSDVYQQNLAKGFWKEGFTVGYESFLHGRVVDMLYFPIVENGRFPDWFPVWGGESFEFFRPVFNIADTAISGGVFALILFQNRFFPEVKENKEETPTVQDTLS
jgi:signal peptidase II